MHVLLIGWSLAVVACEALVPPGSSFKQPKLNQRLRTIVGGEARGGPAGVYDACVALGASKAKTPTSKLLTLGFLSGAHIALGAFLAVSVGGSIPAIKQAAPGLQRIILGMFGLPMGLLMVLGGGGELVTGNFALVSAATAAGKCTVADLVRNWAVVFWSNFAGSLAVAGIASVAATGVAQGATTIATAKMAGSWANCIARGVLCNWLVCMAVWMSTAHKDLASKAAGVFFPISGFIALGLEHSVANQFLIPFGMMQGAAISFPAFLFNNLLPVTIGNIIGGGLFVGLAYHNAYGA